MNGNQHLVTRTACNCVNQCGMHLRLPKDARVTLNNETTVVYFLHYSTCDRIAPKISEPENSQTNQQILNIFT